MAACPRCEREMDAVDAGGLEVMRCPSCRGLWLEGNGLYQAVDMSESDLSAVLSCSSLKPPGGIVLDHPAAFCPRCSSPLKPQRFELELATIIDFCPLGHGIWLDAGELDGIYEYCRKRKVRLAREAAFHPLRTAVREELEKKRARENLAKGERDLMIADALMGILGAVLAVGLAAGTRSPVHAAGFASAWRGGWKTPKKKKKRDPRQA